jgi:hypothetical protein
MENSTAPAALRRKRITLNVDIEEVRDLLERVPRACVAFVTEAGPHVEPVTVVCKDDRFFVGLSPNAVMHLRGQTEAVLVIDDGLQFFDLRAVYVRGYLHPRDGMEDNGNRADDYVWFVIGPTRTVAWDYARIREVADEP